MTVKMKHSVIIFFYHYSALVYVTTAANPNEDAYACYYDKERQIYLGDVYSANWMDNSDAVCTCVYTLFI